MTRRRGPARTLALVPPVQHVVDPTLVAQLDVIARVRDERDEALTRLQEVEGERDDWRAVAVAWAPPYGPAYCLNRDPTGMPCSLPPAHPARCVFLGYS